MNRSYRVALFCGAFPLLLGVSIFILWLITHWAWLMAAGICTLFAGAALFVVGVVALARFCWLAFRTPDLPRRRVWLSTVACAGLLLLNFPVAHGFVAALIEIETSYTVVIHNASQQPLTDVTVFGGGYNVTWSAIPPGGTAVSSVSP